MSDDTKDAGREVGKEETQAAPASGAPAQKKHEGSPWKQRIGLYGGMLAILIIAAIIPRVYNTNKSIELATPEGEAVRYTGPSYLYALETAPERDAALPLMYAQDDPEWKDDSIGETGYTIGEAGSLACVLAYDAPNETTPGEINRRLTEAGAYSDTGNVDWEKVNEALAPMRYTLHDPKNDKFDPALAIESLREGKSVLLLVADKDNMALWLWLAAAGDGEYRVYLPSGGMETLTPYGRVYALVVGEHIP